MVITVLYNPLNLPGTITKDDETIRHTYDGSGARLRTERPDGSVTNYAGPIVQDEDGTYIQFADGRILLDKSQPSPTDDPVLRYQYKIQDHLGNTVVTFEDIDGDGQIIGAEVLQRELYYPFGLPLDNFYTKPGAPLTPEQPFLYNGKAYETAQDLNWYFYGARWYDPGMGRFLGVDPIASSLSTISPYSYAMNNPVLFIDKFGLAPAQPEHDYFDSNGNYLGNDGKKDPYYKSETIRIVDAEGVRSGNWFENSTRLSRNLLSESAAGNIGTHYLKSIGRDDLSAIGAKGVGEYPATGQSDGSELIHKGINVFADKPTILIPVSLGHLNNDIGSFKNFLYHETFHVDDFMFDGGAGMYRTFDSTIGMSDFATALHLEIYLQQIQHTTFSEMSFRSRDYMIAYTREGVIGRLSDKGLQTYFKNQLSKLNIK